MSEKHEKKFLAIKKEVAKICPECGHNVVDVVISTYPFFVTQEECINCDWLGEYKEHKNKQRI